MLNRAGGLLLLSLLLPGCESVVHPSGTEPLGIVLMIGDGMGQGSVAAARIRAGELAMEALPVRGFLRTASTSHDVTDSGAAATALATGVRTYNGAIGVGPDRVPRLTVLEAAEGRGMATGLIATSALTHATPAAFAAHVPSRTMQMDIATQMASSGVDVLLGGGRRYFQSATRPDAVDLIERFRARGCALRDVADPLLRPLDASCLVGFFADDAMPPVTNPRTPALAEMAVSALDVLRKDVDGFFLMIEGSQIDWAGHANAGDLHVAETLEFDAAVRAVRAVLKDRPNTVVIVTADHETGGLSAEPGPGPGEVIYRWTTGDHTAALVPLFAEGPSTERLSGTHSVDSVGSFLLRLVQAP